MEENIAHQNWFNRNWKWAVPTGGCLLVIILFIVFAGSMIFGVSTLFKGAEPYKTALSFASSNELVIDAIGEPIEENGISKGSVNYTNGEGHCNLEIPIEGPKGKAIIFVVADKFGENWEYKVLEVNVSETGEIIQLQTPENKLDQY